MIIVLKPGTTKEQTNAFIDFMENKGVSIHQSLGEDHTILGVIGDTRLMDDHTIKSHQIVKDVLRVQEPYKKANRLFHPLDTIIEVGDRKIGEGNITIIAGPCSVESEEQIAVIADSIKKSGAGFLRGGAFKPRSSPYSFQGLGSTGLDYLVAAREATGLPIVTEIMSLDYIDEFVEKVDIIQVGARNMQNFILLRELGKVDKPILLKRGMSASIQEFLMASEYIMKEGNENVILCERGIRTFENFTRNTLDLSIIPILKKKSHLPVIIDPSHGTGIRWMVEPMAKAAIAAGADGLMIEVHNDPENAWSDGDQSIDLEQFAHLMPVLKKYAEFEGKNI
jgi:3-deoxy-7-phosphoheptulonate synthase